MACILLWALLWGSMIHNDDCSALVADDSREATLHVTLILLSVWLPDCVTEPKNIVTFLDIFSSAIMNDLSVTFTSGLKVDAKCVYQPWNWITVANYFGTPPQLIECMGICILSLAHGSEQRGSDVICEFFRDFSSSFFFWGGSVSQIIFREYIVFRGTSISCSLPSR